jgi:hypothetical protein
MAFNGDDIDKEIRTYCAEKYKLIYDKESVSG